MSTEKSAPAAFTSALYPVGAALVLYPLTDVLSRVFPSNFGNVQWRFALLGLSMSGLAILLLGMTTLGLVAALRANRGMLRAVAIFSAVLVLTLLVTLGVFVRDAMQVRELLANQALRPQFNKMVFSAMAAGVLYLVGFAGVMLASMRAARRPEITDSAVTRRDAAVLVYSAADKQEVPR